MENDTTKNVAETIGKLIIAGYRISGGSMESYGEYDKMVDIALSKRHAYYDDNDYLQGFDELIKIDIATGDMEISHRPVEKYKRYPSK